MTLKRNIIANFLGKIWTGAISFLFIPIYIKFLGIESYGLIGFFASLQAIFSLLDFGISTALNRELAQTADSDTQRKHQNDLVRSLEYIYWATAIAIGLSIFLLAPWISRTWLSSSHLATEDIISVIRLMGLIALLRWPTTLYLAGLLGLQRQILVNLISAIFATLQSGGSAAILLFFSPTILAFFLWQAFCGLVYVALLPVILWKIIDSSVDKPKFSRTSLKRIWRFSFGVFGITATSIILTQLDKVILSNLLSLQDFGYYILASSIAGTLNLAAMAVYAATFPALSNLVSGKYTQQLTVVYHNSCKLLSIIIFPVALALILFSRDLLLAYTQNTEIANKTHVLLSLLAIGNLILSLMMMPLALQLAHGWTKLSFYKNIIALLFFIPAMILLVKSNGAIGASLVWIALTFGYFTMEIPAMHLRLLREEKWTWYLHDLGRPFLVSIIVMVGGRFLFSNELSLQVLVTFIVVLVLLSALFSALTFREFRHWVLNRTPIYR